MIEIGCNYSPELMNLLKAEKVSVDWIKISRYDTYQKECKIAYQYKPILLHIYPHAGMESFDNIDWELMNQYILEYESPHVALHLSSPPSDWDRPVWDYEVVERMIKNIKLWKEKLKVPLIIENVPYFGFKETLRCATDPDVIEEVCEKAEVGFLLDIAHARIAACYRQENSKEYLNKLPLKHVEEIHVNAPGLDTKAGYFRDLHFEMEDADYELLSNVLDQCNPKIVTLEYGGTGPKVEWRSDIDAIERQLTRLQKMLT